MSNFNYQKAWFIFAKPAYKNLTKKQTEVHSTVAALIGKLNQGHDLTIPLTEKITNTLEILTCLELAEIARASNCVGHWLPGNVKPLFDNKRGESWKVSNAIDQILRKRLLDGSKMVRVEILEGIFRVNFSSRDCWLWEEVGLATENNLKVINKIGLKYDQDTFKEHADKIKFTLGDLWNTDNMGLFTNEDYEEFSKSEIVIAVEKQKQSKIDQIEKLKQQIKDESLECNCKIEALEKGLSIDNLIYYSHTKEWVLGWHELVTQEESEQWRSVDLSFDIKIKLRDGTER